jgi:tRNA pseudouridine55 synthase
VNQPSGAAGASGLVVVDKPAGMTSHDVVACIRRLAGTRKVGHAGTLDPMATGVLVVGINRATRLLGHLMLTEKAYDATIRLGASTTTDDAEGDIIDTQSTADLSEEVIRAALARFEGEIAQVPSAVSAIKVQGKRAYQRIREGEDVELRPRRVRIHHLALHDLRWGSDELVDLRVSVRCSSGTYIRAIARDLGRALGVGGHLTALRRTAVGAFTLASACALDELATQWHIIDLKDAARASFASYELSVQEAADARVGRPLGEPLPGLTAVFAPDGEFLALYEPADTGAHPVAVFVG